MTEVAMLREIIAEKQKEIDELKRLLCLAINDLEVIGSCANCESESDEDDPHCHKWSCRWQWKHEAEAEKLLGGDSDA